MYYGALSIRAEAWLIVSPEVTKIMAKEQTDRTTLDLFAHERRPGRPKTNPLKRVELKLNAEAVEALNELAESRNMSRSELIEEMLMQQLAALRSQGIV